MLDSHLLRHFWARQTRLLQHLAEEHSLPNRGANRAELPGDTRRLGDMVEPTPAVATALDGGGDLSWLEALLEPVEAELEPTLQAIRTKSFFLDRVDTETVRLEGVLCPLDFWHGVVVPNEPEVRRSNPVLHGQGRRELGVGRLGVVEEQAWMPFRVGRVRVRLVHYGRRLALVELADFHRGEQLRGRGRVGVLLVDAPIRVDRLASRHHDLIRPARVVGHELGNVVDRFLVRHVDARLRRRVLLDLLAREGFAVGRGGGGAGHQGRRHRTRHDHRGTRAADREGMAPHAGTCR
mmetsp:Transcript_36651/g.98181  ORF Transcript_36651/g.98181 Transcript_36651/m.98181 type:complete len:294 (+) Transcript_36651:334-1215(+)